MVETQLSKLRGTLDLRFIYDMNGICELNLVVNTWYTASQFLGRVVRACSIFCPHEGYNRSVTPLDVVRVEKRQL